MNIENIKQLASSEKIVATTQFENFSKSIVGTRYLNLVENLIEQIKVFEDQTITQNSNLFSIHQSNDNIHNEFIRYLDFNRINNVRSKWMYEWYHKYCCGLKDKTQLTLNFDKVNRYLNINENVYEVYQTMLNFYITTSKLLHPWEHPFVDYEKFFSLSIKDLYNLKSLDMLYPRVLFSSCIQDNSILVFLEDLKNSSELRRDPRFIKLNPNEGFNYSHHWTKFICGVINILEDNLGSITTNKEETIHQNTINELVISKTF